MTNKTEMTCTRFFVFEEKSSEEPAPVYTAIVLIKPKAIQHSHLPFFDYINLDFLTDFMIRCNCVILQTNDYITL